MESNNHKCELLIIGIGLAGTAASAFAAKRGIKSIQVGWNADLIFATGFIDLLGVHPVQDGNTIENPWEGMAKLIQDIPGHPYAKLTSRS